MIGLIFCIVEFSIQKVWGKYWLHNEEHEYELDDNDDPQSLPKGCHISETLPKHFEPIKFFSFCCIHVSYELLGVRCVYSLTLFPRFLFLDFCFLVFNEKEAKTVPSTRNFINSVKTRITCYIELAEMQYLTFSC